MIRECDAESRLIELYLDIDVLVNTFPHFESEIQTYFEVSLVQSLLIPDSTLVFLPQIIDEMKHDESILLIQVLENNYEAFPPFISYNIGANSLAFSPEEWNRGQSYFFNLILADPDSDMIYFE